MSSSSVKEKYIVLKIMNIYSYFLAVCNFIDTVPEINFQTVPTTAGGGPYLFGVLSSIWFVLLSLQINRISVTSKQKDSEPCVGSVSAPSSHRTVSISTLRFYRAPLKFQDTCPHKKWLWSSSCQVWVAFKSKLKRWINVRHGWISPTECQQHVFHNVWMQLVNFQCGER